MVRSTSPQPGPGVQLPQVEKWGAAGFPAGCLLLGRARRWWQQRARGFPGAGVALLCLSSRAPQAWGPDAAPPLSVLGILASIFQHRDTAVLLLLGQPAASGGRSAGRPGFGVWPCRLLASKRWRRSVCSEDQFHVSLRTEPRNVKLVSPDEPQVTGPSRCPPVGHGPHLSPVGLFFLLLTTGNSGAVLSHVLTAKRF